MRSHLLRLAGVGLAYLLLGCDLLHTDPPPASTPEDRGTLAADGSGQPGRDSTGTPGPVSVDTKSPADSAARRNAELVKTPAPDTAGTPARPDSAATPVVKPVLPADTTKPVHPADTTKPVLPADTTKPVLPADTTKPTLPADTTKPTLPADTTKPVLPADTTKPVLPADTTKPVLPADTTKPVLPADTTKPVLPADTTKPVLPADTTKPTLPVDTAKPVLPAPDATAPYLRSDLEDQSATCWGARGTSGYTSAACGPWSQVGGSGARLATGLGHSGTKSLSVTFSKNEEVAGASLPLSADTVHVRAWYYFAEGFDFGQGVKVGRISSFNEATQLNDIDIIMTVRSSGGVNQCGLTPMADLGIFFNGRPAGYDWGNITAARPFQRGTWHAIEYQVALNRPGRSDGAVKLWVDGTLAAQKTGLNLRGTASTAKLNRLRIGGWYSNSAGGNPCADPSQPSTMHVDDVAVGKAYIGP